MDTWSRTNFKLISHTRQREVHLPLFGANARPYCPECPTGEAGLSRQQHGNATTITTIAAISTTNNNNKTLTSTMTTANTATSCTRRTCLRTCTKSCRHDSGDWVKNTAFLVRASNNTTMLSPYLGAEVRGHKPLIVRKFFALSFGHSIAFAGKSNKPVQYPLPPRSNESSSPLFSLLPLLTLNVE